MKKIFNLFIFVIIFTAGVFAFADQPPSSDQTSYLDDVNKLIDKSRENINEINDKIKNQAILKRNQMRAERAHEYYEKGVELTKEGKLDDARVYFEKAIHITEHPEMVSYIRQKEDVEATYAKAVDLYNHKKYHPAKDAFEHIEKIAPGYEATESYLKIIDQDIATADALAAKQKALELERQQKEAEAARDREKQMWLAQIEEKEHQDAINRQANEVYSQALDLYKKKRFFEAKKKFEEVSWVLPDYKSTSKYLSHIDRDAQEEQERIAQEQQKALQEQQWEEEIEKKKQEARRLNDLKVKELQHKKELREQAQFLYAAAVKLFDKKMMDQALEQFNDIEKTFPDFKSTRIYIARIKQWQFEQDQRQKEEQIRQQELQRRQLELIAAKEYDAAVNDYTAGNFQAAKDELMKVFESFPDYKLTQKYLSDIDDKIIEAKSGKLHQPKFTAKPAQAAVIAPAPKPVLPPPPVPVAAVTPVVNIAVSLEDQQKQAQEIAALAEKSAQLYRQIADIADDSSTIQTKRKMAQVDAVLNNLKENKERLLRQMQEEQWKRSQEESKTKQEQRRAEAERTYQQALELLRSHDYAKAKIKFLKLENIIPDYKATRHYLSRIEVDLKNGNVEAVTGYEQSQAAYLKQLQDKENTFQLRHAQEEQEKQRMIEQQEQAEIQNLAQKASAINDDIISLSKVQDYEAMKVKFTELENTVTALTTLKDEMAKEKDRQERERQLARESAHQKADMQRAQRKEDQQIHAYYTAQPKKEYRPVLSNQPSDADYYKRREIMQEQNMLFSEGVDRFQHKKYSQAKLLFGELAEQNDHRAQVWLIKVDRAITHELLNSEVGEERERTAFIADQVKAQHELIIIQERERQRQKKLTEELESQQRLYEDDRLLQLRKEETMKAQERERQRQEEKRLRLERENEKQEQMLRFHKIKPVVKVNPVSQPAILAPKPQPPVVTVAVAPPAPKPPAVSQEQMRQARIKAAQDARQKRIEERQKERDRQKQLRAQRIAERQKERQHQQELKAQQDRLQAEKSAQEQRRREELSRQQEEQREEKTRQDEIIREESQRRQELEHQEQERQTQLEAQREIVRKELVDGVESMYQDALRLYQDGEYASAADRFKDVQDIIPDYKHAEQYMNEARMKSLAVKSQAQAPVPPNTPNQENVSKALDLFDPNAK